MKKNDLFIDMYLQEQQCTMINPGYKHLKDEDGFITFTKQERNPDNLTKLENTVSQRMQLGYKHALIETLEKKTPIVYIDCSERGEDDIMFFILKEYIKHSKAMDKNTAITQAIGNHSIVTPSRKDRNEYIQGKTPDMEEILSQYTKFFKKFLEANTTDEYKKILLDVESAITFDGLGKLMEQEDQKYLYLYLDQIQSLDIDEQQRINAFLYARGGIHHNRWIRVKINNGKGVWKTRSSIGNHRVEATHDYSEINIYEKDLK